MKIVISSGHGKYIRGASGYLDEVDEARKVVNKVAELLGAAGVRVETFHDDVSHSQSENLDRIVNFHNGEGDHDLDISVHFNAYETTGAPMGTECLYKTMATLAQTVATEISLASGLKNRGPKYRDDLKFLNSTREKAILVEVCFVDSQADADIYRARFNSICMAIAETVSGIDIQSPPPIEPPTTTPPPSTGDVTGFRAKGKCSSFGGPTDTGVSPSEGLAFLFAVEDRPELFLPFQPEGTTGLARRLNPYTHYVACRWDYAVTPKNVLKKGVALVKASKTGIKLKAMPADWGPNENTGRVADLSPCLLEDLGIKTDDEVEVIFPA